MECEELRPSVGWKAGFEIELMAPRGCSRRDLAERTANRVGGAVKRIFHPDSEPAKVQGTELFENLTPGFEVTDDKGRWVASFVDDLTLQHGLDKHVKSKSGWYRIVSDDNRIIRLIEEQCSASSSIEDVLVPLAGLFGTQVEPHHNGMIRVSDKRNMSVAIAAPLPGERERPCEIVTAPMDGNHEERLTELLNDASELGFFIPAESATHIHFDAKPLRSAGFVSRFVAMVAQFETDLKIVMRTNPACVRMGSYSPGLVAAVAQSDFTRMSWNQARDALSTLGLTKYCDYNLVNMVNQTEDKDTLEIRTLPGMMNVQDILSCTRFFEALIRLCLDDRSELPSSFEALISVLPLTHIEADNWMRLYNSLKW